MRKGKIDFLQRKDERTETSSQFLAIMNTSPVYIPLELAQQYVQRWDIFILPANLLQNVQGKRLRLRGIKLKFLHGFSSQTEKTPIVY